MIEVVSEPDQSVTLFIAIISYQYEICLKVRCKNTDFLGINDPKAIKKDDLVLISVCLNTQDDVFTESSARFRNCKRKFDSIDVSIMKACETLRMLFCSSPDIGII